jgi:Domain of unknown function (DUF4082)/Bacterial Ig domain/Fibronectin type III domain/Lysyl oxidase
VSALAGALVVLTTGALIPTSAVAAPDTIFGNTTPATIDSGDPGSVELGVKFQSEVAGSVVGVRFYKATGNTGTHIGSLWSADGTLLASATFAGETASGWQQVSFSKPVQITANTAYVAAYLAPEGHYSDTASGFESTGVSNPPLSALANDISPDGVYTYSSGQTFPTSTFNATNYWVDVEFEPPATVPGQVTNVKATAGAGSASLTWSAPSSGGPVFEYTITPYIGSQAQPSTTLTGAPPPTGDTVTGLHAGTSYTFTVAAANALGAGPASEPSSPVTPTDATAPAAPTGVTATAGDMSATVKWTAPFDGGSPITSYKVIPYVGSTAQAATTVSGSPPETQATITGLNNGTSYTFTVAASNALGEGPPSEHSSAVTPTVTPIAYPDLKLLMPTGDISIVSSGESRTLEFTHITWDAGAGPLEIRPRYDSLTGISQGYQALYTSPSPGVWQFADSVPIVGPMIWAPPSDYNFALNSFGLYTVASGGGIGSLVATSPKVLYCMTSDTLVGGVPNTPSDNGYPGSACGQPEGTLGLSVGWGDQYDATDGGEGIPISSLPNGAYWLRGVVDPNHYFAESNTANNITETKLQIEGNAVKVLEQIHPEVAPPTVALTSPAEGATVSGATTLSATASGPSPISSVQFLLDGQPIGAPVTASPYTLDWSTTGIAPGSHYLSARATDGNGFVGTAADVPVTVGTRVGSVRIDTVVSESGKSTTATPAFSTAEPGEVLVAFAGSDGPSSGGQTLEVSGAGLQWSLVKRANSQAGDAEIWTATALSSLLNASVTATAADGGYTQTLTVVAFSRAAGVGASSAAGAAEGAPAVSLTSTQAGSAAFATGNDYDNAIARTLGGEQEMLEQTLNESTGDTFWTQYATAPSSAAGQTMTLDDTAPTTDRWNMAAVEVLPAGPEEPDEEPPSVAIVNPTPGATVSGTTQLSANANDNVAVASVQFYLDGEPLGQPVGKAPYAISWDTTTASEGSHTLTATATDTSGNAGHSAPVEVFVQNPVEEPACFIADVIVSAEGEQKVKTPKFTTAEPGEQLFAFVSADGPQGAGMQWAKVAGARLRWKRLARANSQSGDAEIWTAEAPEQIVNKRVKSSLHLEGYDQQLTLVAMQGAKGAGATVTGGAPSGEPRVTLKTQQAGSLVYAVGSDWDSAVARTLGPNQTLLRQDLDTAAGNTFWSQFTSGLTGSAESLVTMNDTAPTGDQWNMAAVEIVAANVGGNY